MPLALEAKNKQLSAADLAAKIISPHNLIHEHCYFNRNIK
jgi:hypothetical protein